MSNLDNKSRDEIYKKIAIRLLQEVLNEDLSVISNREKIIDIYKKISSEQEEKNYFLIHSKLNNNQVDQSLQNDDFIYMLKRNNEKLYNQIYNQIKNEFMFEIELHKYGKIFNSIRKRWAYILYPDIFASTNDPFLSSQNKNKPRNFKNKNHCLENMKDINIQEYNRDLKNYKTDKDKNPVRIVIKYIETNKKNRESELYLYFDDVTKAKQTYDLIILMRMKFLEKKSNNFPKKLKDTIENIGKSHIFVMMKKFIDEKNFLKEKQLKNGKQNEKEFDGIVQKIKPKLPSFANSKKFCLGTKFNNLLLNMRKKEENNYSGFNSITIFENAIELLRRFFLNNLKKMNPAKYLNNSPAAYIHNFEEIEVSENDKKVRFKIKKSILKGILPQNHKNRNFNSLIFESSKEISINTKKNEIKFGDDPNTLLNSEDITDISSIYLNFNQYGEYEENSILINGPKKDLHKFFTYKLSEKFITENKIGQTNSKLIEPEFYGLRIEQNFPNKFSPLLIQIFHTSINIPLKYLNYIEGLYSSDNINESNKSEDHHSFQFRNPLNDFYIYLSININNRFYSRSKLTKPSLLENENLLVEFNNQMNLNLDVIENIKNFHMKISVNLIPVSCLEGRKIEMIKNKVLLGSRAINSPNSDNEFKVENFIEHLKPHEIGFCSLDLSDLQSKKNLFILKNHFSDNETNQNYIVLNFIKSTELYDRKCITKFSAKDFSIGEEVYFKIEYTREDFRKILDDPDIPEEIKEKFYNVEFDEEDYFLLRPNIDDQKEFIKNLHDNPNQRFEEKILKILKNSKYKYLPTCEIFNTDILSKSTNMYLNEKYVNDNCLSNKDVIFRLKKIVKYSLCKIVGIGTNNNIIIKDKFLGKIVSLDNLNLLIQKSNFSKDKYFGNESHSEDAPENVFIQETPFSIYDFSEINLSQIENFMNHNWNISLKFINRLEMDTFLFYLRELRRNSNFVEKSKTVIDFPIDVKQLINSVNLLKNDIKVMNLLLDKIEFKNSFKLKKNGKLNIELFRGNIYNIKDENSASNLSIIEILADEKNTKYKNSLILNQQVKNEYDFFIAAKSMKISVQNKLDFDEDKLVKLKNQIKFEEKTTDYKSLEVNVRPMKDNIFSLKIFFELNDRSILSMQDQYNFFCEADFSNVINFTVSADFVRLPIYSEFDNSIIGMVDLNYWIPDTKMMNLPKEEQFGKLFNKRFSNIAEINDIMIDNFGNLIPIGQLHPNIFKRKILGIIDREIKMDINSIAEKVINEKDGVVKNKLIKCLKDKGVFGYQNLIEGLSGDRNIWKEIIPDQVFLSVKFFRNYYIKLKKRHFYDKHRQHHWDTFFKQTEYIRESAYGKPKEVIHSEQMNAVISVFNNIDKLISQKKEKSNNYYKIKLLVEMGIPEKIRFIVWEHLLCINKILFLTLDKLKSTEKVDIKNLSEKSKLYEYFLNNVIDNKKFNINFSFIDNDMNYLDKLYQYNEYTGINMDKINERNSNLRKIRNICKAYFVWTDLNINICYEESEKKNKRYIYFFGMLNIIKTILSVVKEENNVFWILIGLSQFIELFYQTNPLISNQMNYSKVYILITKLIMENHFKSIIDHLIRLNFPIEFFLSKLINNLYSDLFETEFFLRIMDIIIFDATIKTNDFDKMDYLRFICTIPLVLLKMNETKILDCKSVHELKNIFDNLFIKTYDHEKFLQEVKDSEEKFYKMDSYFDQFLKINEKNSWDIKRREISDALNSHFSLIEEENNNYLSNLKKLKFSFEEYFIDNYENFLSGEFSSLRKLYSKKNDRTPGINFDDENDISRRNYKLAVCITEFKFLSENLRNFFSNIDNNNDIFIAQFVFSNKKFENFNDPRITDKKIINIKGLTTNNFKYEILHFDFAESYPVYLTIFLSSRNNHNIGFYRFEVVNYDIFKSISLISENLNGDSYSLLEIKLVKYYSQNVDKNDSDLNKFLFRPPRYLYNFKIDNLIDNTNYNEYDNDRMKKFFGVFNKHFISEVNKIFSNESSFAKEQIFQHNLPLELNENLEFNYNFFKKNKNTPNDNIFKSLVGKFINIYGAKEENISLENTVFSSVQTQSNKILDIILESFSINKYKTSRDFKNNNHDSLVENEYEYVTDRNWKRIKTNNVIDKSDDIKNIIKKWIIKNETSFEEILYSLVLIDSVSITIYEKLHLLYQIGKMQNYALCRKDNISLKKVKEMIYALYKRFMVNFNKSEIDIMVDYLLKKEDFASLRFSLIYKSSEVNKIKDIIDENKYQSKDNILQFLRLKNDKIYEDIKIYLENYSNLLKNNFMIEKMNLNYLNTIWEIFSGKLIKKLNIKPNEISTKWTFDKLVIELISDNMRKINDYNIQIYHNSFNIEKNDSDRIQFKNLEGEKKIVEDLIFTDINSLNLSNIANDDSISVPFDKFKDIFFNLPFISEFIRSTSGFSEQTYDYLNRSLDFVKVNLRVGQYIRNFIFYEKQIDPLDNIESRINSNLIRIEERLSSTISFQEIFHKIVKKLKQVGDRILDDAVSYFLQFPNQIIISTNIEGIEKYERMKFYDPLFSSESIRKSENKIPVLDFKLDVNDDISRLDQIGKQKDPGYMKLKHSDKCYEWKECKIKSYPDGKFTAKLSTNSVKNKHEFSLTSFDAFKK